MNAIVEAPDRERRSLLTAMANRYQMEPKAFADTLKGTVVPGNVTNEQFAAFLLVAREYDLNPVTKEIYAFPAKGGGIQPIVSIDGWMKMANSHPQFDGMDFEDTFDDDGKLVAVECRIYRKDRSRPVCVTEYMAECRRSTDPWKQWPARMLRHKAAIQCARYAFGFTGIMEPDEFERMKEAPVSTVEPLSERLAGPKGTEGFDPAHVERETAQTAPHDDNTGEITDAEFTETEPGGIQEANAAEEPEVDGLPSDASGSEFPSDANPQMEEAAAARDVLMRLKKELEKCTDNAEIKAITDAFAGEINAHDVDVKSDARNMIKMRREEIAGGAND